MATEAISIQVSEASSRPYAPGWLDRFITWLHHRPWPTWLSYAGVVIVSVLVSNAQNWLSGAPLGSFTPIQTAWGVVTVAFLALRDYLFQFAGKAFDDFRPALSPGLVDEDRVRYELTTESLRTSLVILAVSVPATVSFYVADPAASQVAGLGPMALTIRTAFESLFTVIVLSLLTQSVRQLRLVTRLHTLADRIDLFQPAPLHAFSRLTSRTGAVLIGFIVLGIALNPDSVRSAAVAFWLPWAIGFPAAAVGIFVVPLLGMHERLVERKAGLRAAADVRLQSVLAALHADVDTLDLGRADGLQKTLASLVQERDILAKLPTWPWSTGTLRGFATAILLPIAIFLIQRTLSQVV